MIVLEIMGHVYLSQHCDRRRTAEVAVMPHKVHSIDLVTVEFDYLVFSDILRVDIKVLKEENNEMGMVLSNTAIPGLSERDQICIAMTMFLSHQISW